MKIGVLAMLLAMTACSVRDGPAPPATLALYAGAVGGPGNADGVGALASFSFPNGVAADAFGNLYVADSGNYTIRKIDRAARVTTLAGSAGQRGSVDGIGAAARFDNPGGVAVDSGGNVYVLDRGVAVRKITPGGEVSTLAGAVNEGSQDGVGSSARFRATQGIAADNAGSVFVADLANRTIRRIGSDGRVTTLAGRTGVHGFLDGEGSDALFASPIDLETDGAGNIYVSDLANNAIRKVTATGSVSSIARGIQQPDAITVDSAANIFVVEHAPAFPFGYQVRKITPAGTATLFAGPFDFEVTGLASCQDTVYLTAGDNVVRAIDRTGHVSALAGEPAAIGYLDGLGPGTRFGEALPMAADARGNLFVGDARNGAVRRIAPGAVVTTLASGITTGGLVVSVAVDAQGNVYTGDAKCEPFRGAGPPPCVGAIRKLTPSGSMSVVALAGSSDGTGTTLANPTGLALDTAGNLYVVDNRESTLRKITPAGDVTTIAGVKNQAGAADGTGAAARFSAPYGLAIDAFGTLYVSDGGSAIRKVSPTGVVTTLAGSVSVRGSVDGVGTAARFSDPRGLAVDEDGNVYVADNANYTIRKVGPSGAVSTIAGTAGLRGFSPGGLPGIIGAPDAVAVSGGDLFMTTGAGVLVIRNRP